MDNKRKDFIIHYILSDYYIEIVEHMCYTIFGGVYVYKKTQNKCSI